MKSNLRALKLAPFEEAHLEKTFQWIQQKNVRKGFNFYREISWDDHLAWFKASQQDQTVKNFAILLTPNHTHIGNCGLKNIDFEKLACEQIIYIGDAAQRGKGYGVEASELLVQYAFQNLGMKKIYLYLSSGNAAARRLYKTIGFTEKSAPSGNIWEGSTVEDVMYMEMAYKGVSE